MRPATTAAAANLSTPERIRLANEAELRAWSDYGDVPIALSVELGRTRLTARGVLELRAGGIIQLARSSGEGVDVVIGNRRLAQGEIVVIEDRTGVRLTDITAAAANVSTANIAPEHQ